MIKLNNIELNFETYPNGETRVDGRQIRDNMEKDGNTIFLKYEKDEDLIKLLFVKSYLDEYRVLTSLVIYYMPYSRMDRVENRSVFTLKYICNLVNYLDFFSVVVIEPHSDVTPALLDRCKVYYPVIDLLEKVMIEVNFNAGKDFIFFPDAGASKRYSKEIGWRQLVGYKKRDFDTGEITHLEVMGDIQERDFKVIIVDDLCSYGGTFIRSARKLKELGASDIYLLVTHCEESIFKGDLFNSGLIKKVFATNSMIGNSSVGDCYIEKIKIYEMEEIIDRASSCW